ncbi:hypothetical protein [Candidatus Ruminimicrobiellum ovillum]|uniref:hypothetical protein n=1 Tax=Candidatus Ruminimicrobiellum ovillum TaxID=1947927 RepID=UPI00355A9BA4
MKVIKIVILTLLITFLLFAASVYITFKYILTPERIKNYVRTYVERTIDEQFEKYKKELLDKISFSGFSSDKEQKTENKDDKKPDENIESVEVLESVGDINYLATKFANIDMVQGINDVNLLSHKVFGDVNLKIEKLKNKVTEYFSNNNKKEE